MALKVYKTIKHNGVNFRSGHVYEFKYAGYENDPRPLVVFVNAIKGINPSTYHQWRLISCINLNYIPRKGRKRFIKIWKKEMEKGNSVEMTWKKVQSQFPYLKLAWRRYLTKPKYYIRSVTYIPPEKWHQEVIRSLPKDFSKAIRRKVGAKVKQFFAGKRKK